jgi:hypothetical protein
MIMGEAGAALERALRVRFVKLTLVEMVSRPWASVTFSGERHKLTIRAAQQETQAFLEGLEEQEFDLYGHILADIALVEESWEGDGVRLVLEALTVEDI